MFFDLIDIPEGELELCFLDVDFNISLRSDGSSRNYVKVPRQSCGGEGQSSSVIIATLSLLDCFAFLPGYFVSCLVGPSTHCSEL